MIYSRQPAGSEAGTSFRRGCVAPGLSSRSTAAVASAGRQEVRRGADGVVGPACSVGIGWTRAVGELKFAMGLGCPWEIPTSCRGAVQPCSTTRGVPDQSQSWLWPWPLRVQGP